LPTAHRSGLSLNLTLCPHELATNAVKYGALSNGIGQVQMSWDTAVEADQRRLYLTWQEAGGPPVKEAAHKGFGSQLIQSTGNTDTGSSFAGVALNVFSTWPFSFCVRAFAR
jgi:two-component sensor histidine kinase